MIESEPFIVAASEDGYACTWLDSDNDGLPDYAEKIYGTDPENADTDGDGLSDYDEIYKTGTNPLKYDTDEDGVNDADSDNDKDGLTNSEELALGTDPNSADTDGDGLSDYDEINKHNTDPLKTDSDGDTLNDGDEIILGLDPNDPETFGVPDAEYKVKQTISADSEVMERVNTEDSPYELSLEITASGNAQNLIAGSSAYSTITESDARLGGAVSLDYYGGDVEKVKLSYEIGESYISNEGSEYAKNCVDLQGIKRYNIFRYFDDINMLLPVATEFDEENNTLFAETDELGTYCVLDMEVLLQTFGVNPDGSQTGGVNQMMLSNIASGASPHYNVTFFIDTRSNYIMKNDLKQIKDEICSFMSLALDNGENITVNIYTQYDTSSGEDGIELIGYFDDISSLEISLDSLSTHGSDNPVLIFDITDGLELYSYQSLGSKNYIFDIFVNDNVYFDLKSFKTIEANAYYTGVSINYITNSYANVENLQIPFSRGGNIIGDFNGFGEKAFDIVFDSRAISPEPYQVFLSSGLQVVYLDDKLYPNSKNPWGKDMDSDKDGKTDWDEVNWDFVNSYWNDEGISVIPEETGVTMEDMPTIKYCLVYESEKSGAYYIEDSLHRLMTSNYAQSLYNCHFVPIVSNPANPDSDGDGFYDSITGDYSPIGYYKIEDKWPLTSEPHPAFYQNEGNYYYNHITFPKTEVGGRVGGYAPHDLDLSEYEQKFIYKLCSIIDDDMLFASNLTPLLVMAICAHESSCKCIYNTYTTDVMGYMQINYSYVHAYCENGQYDDQWLQKFRSEVLQWTEISTDDFRILGQKTDKSRIDQLLKDNPFVNIMFGTAMLYQHCIIQKDMWEGLRSYCWTGDNSSAWEDIYYTNTLSLIIGEEAIYEDKYKTDDYDYSVTINNAVIRLQ